MEAHVEFFASEEDAKQTATRGGVRMTKMAFYPLPKVGDVITLDFPEYILKRNKHFRKYPTYPYTVTHVYEIKHEVPYKIEVYYSGETPVNFDNLR